MMKKVVKTAVGIVLSLGIAVPGFSSTALEFIGNTGTGGGIVVSNGGTGSITALEADFNQELMIVGATGTGANDNGTWNVTASLVNNSGANPGVDNLTMTVTVGTCQSGCTSGNLNGSAVTLAIDYSSLGTFTSGSPSSGQFQASGSAIADELGTPTSIKDLSSGTTLLSLLGLTNNPSLSLVTGGTSFINGTGANTGSGSYSYTADSQTIAFQVSATPEPASWLILASGLVGLACFARRRTVRS